MSLMRLLSMGRSLNEVKNVGRYHVPRAVGLPQFSFGKPAVKPSAAPSSAAVASTPTRPAKVALAGRWLQRSNPFTAALPVAEATRATPAPAQAELTLEKATVEKPTIEQVQVARNNLSETDFEIVPQRELPRQAEIKPYRKRNQPAAVPDGDMLGAKAWNWLGSRLFGAAARH